MMLGKARILLHSLFLAGKRRKEKKKKGRTTVTLKAQALSDKTASGKNYFCSPRCASKASSRAFYERQAKRAASAEGEEPIRYPIRGVFFGCCASTITATASIAPANRIDASAV